MIPRRTFIKTILTFLVALFCFPRRALSVSSGQGKKTTIAVALDTDKKKVLRAALDALGGIERWVKKGMHVVIKPNVAWARTPDEAANVHPYLVHHLIKFCYEAGARSVDVVEFPCDNYKSAFGISEVADAVERAGTRMRTLSYADKRDFVTIPVPQGKILKEVDIARCVLDADLFINMPVAKSHEAATLTMGLKNQMGTIYNCEYFHVHGLHQCIADLSTVLHPGLIVVDATRLLLTNGPKGPGEVRVENKVIVGTDLVAVDAFTATLFGYTGNDIGHVKMAYDHGVGEIDLKRVDIKKINC
ncbi:MAG: DUF362 domain-containing protein [Candidatus Omnitrophica bacterium]|nr:DUF362 domain-containing protein [Candidatus Omnitrophota bacterium]